jgi:pantoate kinase
MPSSEEQDVVMINGQMSDAPVTRSVVKRIGRQEVPVKVSTAQQMTTGAGFGASGAGALGCAYALNQHLGLGLTANQAASVAHCAEVENCTGLGDVIAQNTGGLVIRLRPGAPGIGVVDRIPLGSTRIDCVVRGSISTKDVLSDQSVMRSINAAGEKALHELVKRPTIENFMLLSKGFAIESGLATEWVVDVIEAVEADGGMASMIMLGEAVFSIGYTPSLSSFGDVIKTHVSQLGAHLD